MVRFLDPEIVEKVDKSYIGFNLSGINLVFNERKLVLGPAHVKVKVKVKV